MISERFSVSEQIAYANVRPKRPYEQAPAGEATRILVDWLRPWGSQNLNRLLEMD